MADAPKVLTVVLADTWTSYVTLMHTGEHMGWYCRTVHIELTPEQRALLTPRNVGHGDGKDKFEEIVSVFLESEDQ